MPRREGIFSMSIDHPKVAVQPSLVAEMREIVEETRKTIEASQVILDRCAAPAAEEPARDPVDPASELVGLLEGIADGLIVAHEYAKLDADAPTLALIEKAMLHVGRRLARAIGPKQAGVACH